MKRFALLAMLCLPLGTVHGTFELEDPANQIIEELRAEKEREEQEERKLQAICTVDAETRACSCVHRENGDEIRMNREDCIIRAVESQFRPQP